MVEDDPNVRALLASVLKGRGYTVLEAADAGEALSLCHARGSLVSLVITDVIMPHMNGPQLTRKLKGIIPTAKILYISGYVGDAVAVDLAETDASYLQKPFGPHELTKKVRMLLDG